LKSVERRGAENDNGSGDMDSESFLSLLVGVSGSTTEPIFFSPVTKLLFFTFGLLVSSERYEVDLERGLILLRQVLSVDICIVEGRP